MRISTKGRYGLRALVDIAAHEDGGYITLKSVANRLGISENYLEQLIATMKRAGFVKSIRGAQGGYALSCDPARTTAGDILRALEGTMYPVDCVSDEEAACCGKTPCGNCVTRPIWEKMYDNINDALDSFTLEQLTRDYRREAGAESEVAAE